MKETETHAEAAKAKFRCDDYADLELEAYASGDGSYKLAVATRDKDSAKGYETFATMTAAEARDLARWLDAFAAAVDAANGVDNAG